MDVSSHLNRNIFFSGITAVHPWFFFFNLYNVAFTFIVIVKLLRFFTFSHIWQAWLIYFSVFSWRWIIEFPCVLYFWCFEYTSAGLDSLSSISHFLFGNVFSCIKYVRKCLRSFMISGLYVLSIIGCYFQPLGSIISYICGVYINS